MHKDRRMVSNAELLRSRLTAFGDYLSAGFIAMAIDFFKYVLLCYASAGRRFCAITERRVTRAGEHAHGDLHALAERPDQ